MNKKYYIIPAIQVIDNEELCTSGMNNNSWSTETTNAADDQQDVTGGVPTIEGELPSSGPGPAAKSSWGSWSDEY